jgi:hypothetical protein
MREKEYKIIDGVEYMCQMMDVRSAHRTLLGICNTLGEPIVKAIAEGAEDAEGDAVRLISAALSAATQNLEGARGERLIEVVFDGVYKSGREDGFELKAWSDKFNEHFQGRLLSVYKVWAWAVQVNYRDFFDAAQSLGADKAKGLGNQVFSALQTRTSPSGQSSSTRE